MVHEPAKSQQIKPSVLYFGTPVALISTLNRHGKHNISPMSSVWALGDRLILGLANESQGCENLQARGEAVVNLPGPSLVSAVESLAPTTGRLQVPAHKQAMGYRYEPDKFALASLTAAASSVVQPPRIAECPLQIEVQLVAAHPATTLEDGDPGFMLLEARAVCVHAHESMVIDDTQHIDTAKWSPLLYVFRHYFGTGRKLGRNFRAETA